MSRGSYLHTYGLTVELPSFVDSLFCELLIGQSALQWRGASAARGSCGGGSGEQRQVRVIGTPVSR